MERSSSARRWLFEEVPEEEINRELDELEQQIAASNGDSSARWGFDFDEGVPLADPAASYKYQVLDINKVPSFYSRGSKKHQRVGRGRMKREETPLEDASSLPLGRDLPPPRISPIRVSPQRLPSPSRALPQPQPSPRRVIRQPQPSPRRVLPQPQPSPSRENPEPQPSPGRVVSPAQPSPSRAVSPLQSPSRVLPPTLPSPSRVLPVTQSATRRLFRRHSPSPSRVLPQLRASPTESPLKTLPRSARRTKEEAEKEKKIRNGFSKLPNLKQPRITNYMSLRKRIPEEPKPKEEREEGQGKVAVKSANGCAPSLRSPIKSPSSRSTAAICARITRSKAAKAAIAKSPRKSGGSICSG